MLSQDISFKLGNLNFPDALRGNNVSLIGHERLRKALDGLEGKVRGRSLTPKPIVVVHDQIAFALPLSGHGLDGAADHLVSSKEICPLFVPHHVDAEAQASP